MAPRLDPKKRVGREMVDNINKVGLSIDDNLKAMEDIGSADFVVRDIEIEKIIPSTKNFFKVDDIEDLAEDIRENGLSHNLLVRPISGDRFEIISGERRFKALKILGRTKAPCKVEEDLKENDIDTEIKLINTNAKTRQLTDLEKAEVIKRLGILYRSKKSEGIKIKGRIRDNIASDLGISGIKVERLNKLNKLTPGLKEALGRNKISVSAVEQFSGMDTQTQKVMLSLIKNGEFVDTERAKKLKTEWEKTKDKLKTEVGILENENKLQQKKLIEAEEKLSNSNLKLSKDVKTDQSNIENNAAVAIASSMLLDLVNKKDLKISAKNLNELKKLKDRLEAIF
jgi:ParB family transcriptional regulator, chromosome partitioning protein